jgi:ketosteroid isomerase-like protein
MPSENLELARSIYAGWERGDYSSAEWADSEIEYVIADGPAAGSWKGLTRMAEGVREWLSAWEDFRFEAVEYRELDRERVLVLTVFRGQGRSSGLRVEQMPVKAAGLFHIRAGKVTKLVVYFDRERALGELGLAPEDLGK